MRVSILPAIPTHVVTLAGQLRDGDAGEIAAAGITPHRALWRSYRSSLYVRTALVDSDVAAVWGLGGTALGMIGQPWLLTGPAVERAKIAFLRHARAEVVRMLTVFPELRGVCDARYGRALRLLEALGFDIGAEVAFGPKRALFREYSMRRGAN